ncbi:MAG: hypothetical protein AABX80_01255 [Nanoarchaeota archaeon]
MEKVEIGIYKNHREYFALGIFGYKMKEVKNNDKYCLGLKIRDELNKKKIKSCFIRRFKNSDKDYFPLTKSELEVIADSMSFNTNNKYFKVKIKKEIYSKK